MAMSEIDRKEAPSIQKYVKHFDLTDSRLDSDRSTGFALAHEDQVLHMSLFAKTAESKEDLSDSKMIRFSHRRNRRF